MNQISLKALRISTFIVSFFLMTTSPSSLASRTTDRLGNPKKYILESIQESSWRAKPIKKGGKLKIKSAFISLIGADLKGGVVEVSSKKFGNASLVITNAFLGKGGIFNSKGVLKLKGKEKELFFDIALEPIRKGFILSSKIEFAQEDFDLKLYKKNKKSYDDVVFAVKIKLKEK